MARKIQKLQAVADALADGSTKFFYINRLTVIKSLSAPANAAPAFALDLTRRTIAQMRQAREQVPGEMKLARQAVQAIRAYHRTISDESIGDARELWHTIHASQNEIVRPMGKYPVRLIRSERLFVIGAKTKILIVSFAVYNIPHIVVALTQALQRGVNVSICVESPEASGGKIAYDTRRAFGEEVQRLARIYTWSASQRQPSPDGKLGALHAKVAVADGNALLISSANLTGYALNLNMEMGVLIRDGELPLLAEIHFEALITQKVFELVAVG